MPLASGMGGAVLVTGGSKRIGREISLKLSKAGFSIGIHYNSSGDAASKLSKEIEEMGGEACTLHCDLKDVESARSLIGEMSDSLGPPVGLVNNASLFKLDRIEDISQENWNSHMEVNVLSPLVMISELSKSPTVANPWIVNILDFKIESPNADYLSYTASRFAMHGLTSSLAIDLAPEIRVNAVAPGHILTSDILGKNALEAAQSKSLLGYGATSEEIAEAVLFLATSKSITGQTIFVDSGERMNQRRRDPALEGVDGS